MAHVIALQTLAGPPETDYDDQPDMIKISEFSYAMCGPFPSEISIVGCI